MFFTTKQPKAVLEVLTPADDRFFIGLSQENIGRSDLDPSSGYLLRTLLNDVFHQVVLSPSTAIPGEPSMGYGDILTIKVYPSIGPSFYVGIPKPASGIEREVLFINEFLDLTFQLIESWELDETPEDPEYRPIKPMVITNQSSSDFLVERPEIFVLLVKEDSSEYGARTSLRFFKKQENAMAAMHSGFQNNKKIFGWPDEDDPDREFYVIITDFSVSVKHGEDSYEWEVFVGMPEDIEEVPYD